jgi:hypothetical protein
MPVAAVLDAHSGVLGWQVEMRMVDGVEELIVFLCPAEPDGLRRLLRELDGGLAAAQYVVLTPAELAKRVAAHGGARVVDLRPQA